MMLLENFYCVRHFVLFAKLVAKHGFYGEPNWNKYYLLKSVILQFQDLLHSFTVTFSRIYLFSRSVNSALRCCKIIFALKYIFLSMWCHNSFLANVTFYYSASSWYPPPQQWLWSLSGAWHNDVDTPRTKTELSSCDRPCSHAPRAAEQSSHAAHSSGTLAARSPARSLLRPHTILSPIH